MGVPQEPSEQQAAQVRLFARAQAAAQAWGDTQGCPRKSCFWARSSTTFLQRCKAQSRETGRAQLGLHPELPGGQTPREESSFFPAGAERTCQGLSTPAAQVQQAEAGPGCQLTREALGRAEAPRGLQLRGEMHAVRAAPATLVFWFLLGILCTAPGPLPQQPSAKGALPKCSKPQICQARLSRCPHSSQRS